MRGPWRGLGVGAKGARRGKRSQGRTRRERADGAFGGLMLQANFLLRGTEGATLCQNPETHDYALVRPFPLALTDVESLAAGLESLVNQTENWRKALAGLRMAEDAQKQGVAPAPDGDSHHDMLSSGYFHV